jgi:TatD DNase family protein
MEEFHFKEKREDICENLRKNDVRIINDVGYDLKSSLDALDIELEDGFEHYAFAGIHPHYSEKVIDYELEMLEEILSKKKFSGVGEIGLDKWWHKDENVINRQKEIFIRQLDIASRLKLPAMLHVRNAYEEAFEILKDFSSLKVEFHSFTGTKEELEYICDKEYYFGINGIVTFKNTNLRESIKREHINLLLIESDAPYLSPVPYRGRRNMPYYIVETYKAVSGLLDIDLESLKETVKYNFYEFISKE